MLVRRVAVLVPMSALFAACNAFDEPAGPLPFGGPGVNEVFPGRVSLGTAGFGTAGGTGFSSAGGTSIAGTPGVGGEGVGGQGVGGTGPDVETPVGGSGVALPDASVPEDAGARDDAGVDAGL